MQELEELLSYEKPKLLLGSPPCYPFGHLLEPSKDRGDPGVVEERLARSSRHLHATVRCYRRQQGEGRLFLHEHPENASSWSDSEVQALQKEEGVFTVVGPACFWDLRRQQPSGTDFDPSGPPECLVLRKTKWITNSQEIAKALSQWGQTSVREKPHRIHLHMRDGLVHQANAYPPKLVRSLLVALKKEMLAANEISAVDLSFGGPVPSHQNFEGTEAEVDKWIEEFQSYWDDISGEALPGHLVKGARAEEIDWVRKIKLYDKVPRSLMVQRGHQATSVRWVDVNKGDKHKYNVRSRLCGRELKAKTKEALLAHELFSAMPPWEAVKVLLSLLVTDGINTEELELGVFDISRAHFMPVVSRELYIELPPEDKLPGDGDAVGRLNRNMYGFRDASNGWMKDWQRLLKTGGYLVGVSNPALFYNPVAGARGAVHGDDFYVLGPRVR